MVLTPEQNKMLADAFSCTWQAIGADCEAAWAGGNGFPRHRPSMREVIEVFLEHVEMYGGGYKRSGKPAHDLLTMMISDAGYHPTLNYIQRVVLKGVRYV